MTGTPLPPRPVTQADRDKILIPIKSGLKELIFGDPGLFRDRSGFIAGPTPQTGIATAVQAISRFNCRRWASANKANFSQSVNQGNADLCGPYLDAIGENPTPGSIEPPFQGAQCPVRYNVSLSVSYASVTSFSCGASNATYTQSTATLVRNCTTGIGPIFGPIGGVVDRPPLSPGAQTRRIVLLHRNSTGNPVESEITANWCPAGGGYSLTSFSATRCDGQADNCGSLPPEIKPPATVTPSTPIPPSITINLPGLGPVEVTVALDDEGNPVVCIPELEVCLTLQGDDDGNDDDGNDDDDDRTLDPGEADSEQEQTTESGGVAGGVAGEDKELVGVLVEVVEAPPSANQFNNNPGEIYRGIGYVRMGWEGRLGVDPTGAVVRSPQFFHAQQLGLQSWEVRANIGFRLKATPYYRATKKPE
jgi:hypothetical protein